MTLWHNEESNLEDAPVDLAAGSDAAIAAPGLRLADEARHFAVFFLRWGGFWLLFFLLCRVAFLAYHSSKLALFPVGTLIQVFTYGLYLDLSSTCYLLIVPYLVWLGNRIVGTRFPHRLIRLYHLACLLLVSLITVADLEAYQAYGAKLNAQILAYLRYPREALASISSSPLVLLVVLAALLFAAGVLLYDRICRALPRERALPGAPRRHGARRGLRAALGLVGALLVFIGIRGSLGVAPMNPSFAYFSGFQFANHAALNASWNLVYDLKYYFKHHGKSFVYLPEPEAKSRVARLMGAGLPEATEQVLAVDRPNVVLLILESWTADLIASLGGEKGVTPFFEELSRDGLLFTDFYANGYRSSFGIAAVLAGFPSTPEGSVLNRPRKVDRLPTLAGSLKDSGYRTSFYYGGDDRFDDMNAFLVHSRFDRIVNRDSFQKKDMNSKWGAQDHVLLQRVVEDLGRERQPFFNAVFTLSSHEPFEVPMETVFKGSDQSSQFRNAVHYTDRSLRGFFEAARGEPWYQNTLFILVADHGHLLPRYRSDFVPERYHIPLLLYGPALKSQYRGERRSTVGSQCDLAATVLAQLGLKHPQFTWSNNLFNKNRSDYAFYNTYTGFGLRTPARTTVFDNTGKKVILRVGPQGMPATDGETLKDAQAYMQYLYQRYAAL